MKLRRLVTKGKFPLHGPQQAPMMGLMLNVFLQAPPAPRLTFPEVKKPDGMEFVTRALMSRSFPSLVCLLVAPFLATLGSRSASAQEIEEYHVKAALLAKIPQFIDWPKTGSAGDDKTFVIGILGPSPFGAHLKTLESQMVNKKKIVVRLFKSIDDYEPCHLLFISGIANNDEGAAQRLPKALAKTEGRPVLIVTDQEGLAEKGAVINLYLDGTNVRIEMNRDAEQRAGLTTKAQFLKIVRLVKDAK